MQIPPVWLNRSYQNFIGNLKVISVSLSLNFNLHVKIFAGSVAIRPSKTNKGKIVHLVLSSFHATVFVGSV